MQPYEKIDEFTRKVCEQIRWKRIHPQIKEELENHIVDCKNAYVSRGMDEQSATDKAIAETGDAVVIGTELDRTHRPKPQWGMLALTALLVITGIIVRSHFQVFDVKTMERQSLQLLGPGIGIIAMLAAYFADFTLIGRYVKTVCALALVLPVFALFFSQGFEDMGYTALFLPLAYSAVIYLTKNWEYFGVIICGIILIIPPVILLFVTPFSAGLTFFVCGSVLLSIAIVKNWFLVKRITCFVLAFLPTGMAFLFIMLRYGESIISRLSFAINPALDNLGDGFQGTVARKLLSGARLIGAGELPVEYAELPYFPLPGISSYNLLTYLIFNSGWIVLVVIASLLLIFIIKGFMMCFKQKSGLGLLVSSACMLTFTAEAIGFVIYNLGFVFIAPLSLPLISFGNSALIINLFLIGLMLSVFRTGDAYRDRKTALKERERFISWDNGRLIISFAPKR